MPLDTAGDFYDGTKVTSLPELTAALDEAADAARAQLHREPDGLRRSAAASSTSISRPSARSAKAAEANNYKISSFILGVVKSDAFRMRRVEPEATTTETKASGR